VKRYHYTPRRDGRQSLKPGRSETSGSQGSILPFALPALTIPAVVLGILWLTSGSSGGATCNGARCDTALALGRAPTVAAATETPSPESGPKPSPGPPPQISALSAAVLEEPCGRTVYAFNEHTTYPPASLTKMMTALVAVKFGTMDQLITSPIDGGALSTATDGTVIGLTVGEQLNLRDLLYGLLMRSGNDAALAIAVAIGGSEAGFVQMMNGHALELGLTDTNFTNPHGLDDVHLYSSAYDIAHMGIELLRNPDLAQIVRTTEYEPAWDNGPLTNINLFLGQYPGAIGVKTGYTDTAGQTIVAAAQRGGRTLVAGIMHSADQYVDAAALLDWAFENTNTACP
jgi:D-alanyl-D-alanine carboxypeptidase